MIWRVAITVCLCAAGAVSATPEIWTVRSPQGFVRDYVLWPGGTAVSVSGQDSARGLRGFWSQGDREITVLLESGFGALIQTEPGRISTRSVRDGVLESDASSALPITGPSRKWIGVWIWPDLEGRGTRYVSLTSDRTAISSHGERGRWVPVPRGIRAEWESGAIELLQFRGDSPALRSWASGVQTRSVPPRVSTPLRVESTVAP